MPQFTWMARDPRRTLRSGLIEAPSAGQAAAVLRRLPLAGVAVLPVPSAQATAAGQPDLSGSSHAARLEAVSHVAVLVRQGVPPARACAVAGASVTDTALSEALHEIAMAMRQGGSMADAWAAQPGLVNAFGVALLRECERRGTLGQGLKSLYQYLEFDEQLAQISSPRGWRRVAVRLRVAQPVSSERARLLALTHLYGCLVLGQRAGMDMGPTLLAAREVCGDSEFRRAVGAVHHALTVEGQRLAPALDHAGLLPAAAFGALKQAEHDGRLADCLVEITRELRAQAEAAQAT
jgi:type II secretory pathway component PulF